MFKSVSHALNSLQIIHDPDERSETILNELVAKSMRDCNYLDSTQQVTLTAPRNASTPASSPSISASSGGQQMVQSPEQSGISCSPRASPEFVSSW